MQTIRRGLGRGLNIGLNRERFSRWISSRLHDPQGQDRPRGMLVHQLPGLFSNETFDAYPVEEHSRVVGIVTKFNYLAAFVGSPSSSHSF